MRVHHAEVLLNGVLLALQPWGIPGGEMGSGVFGDTGLLA